MFKRNFELIATKLLSCKFTYQKVKFDLLSYCDLHFKFTINEYLTLIVFVEVPSLLWNQRRNEWEPNEKGEWKLLFHHEGENHPLIYTLMPVTVDEMMPRLNKEIPTYKCHIKQFLRTGKKVKKKK